MKWSASLSAGPIDAAAEYGDFLARGGGEGAVVTFLGVARPRTGDGSRVDRLFLDHHPRLTQASLNEIARAAAGRFEVSRLRIVHRCGEIAPGAPIVWVAAASAHRRAAFEAADYLMDRLKSDAFFWKREDGEAGSRWIEPTDDDRAARARWDGHGGSQ